MRRAALAFVAWAALASLAGAQSEVVVNIEPPEGWPWKLGDVTGTLGGTAMAWETYDFSIGALDAAVWAGDWEGPVVLHLRAHVPGRPQQAQRQLRVNADFGDRLQAGPATGPVTVLYLRGAEEGGARMSSEGQTASLTIESLMKDPENVNYGHITGTITARLCPVNWFGKTCQDLSLRFDTDMQFDGEFPIRPGKM